MAAGSPNYCFWITVTLFILLFNYYTGKKRCYFTSFDNSNEFRIHVIPKKMVPIWYLMLIYLILFTTVCSFTKFKLFDDYIIFSSNSCSYTTFYSSLTVHSPSSKNHPVRSPPLLLHLHKQLHHRFLNHNPITLPNHLAIWSHASEDKKEGGG